MLVAAELAGFFAAHAVWLLWEEQEFLPMLAYSLPDQKHGMEQLIHADPLEAVKLAKTKLNENENSASHAAVIFAGKVQQGPDKLDAILTELRTYAAPKAVAAIAVPFTRKADGKLAVHIPLLVSWIDCEGFTKAEVMQAFFKGVNGHEQGSTIWNECYDESR